MLLLIPMEMVYKQVNRWTKVCYTWIFTKVSVLCTSKIDMYIKRIGYVQGNNYVHKRIGTYTVREAHDRLRNSEEKQVRFYLQIGSIMEKRCVSLLKSFEKILKMFWKMKYIHKKFGKDSSFKKFERNIFEKYLKVPKTYRFRLNKNIIKRKYFWIFLTLS